MTLVSRVPVSRVLAVRALAATGLAAGLLLGACGDDEAPVALTGEVVTALGVDVADCVAERLDDDEVVAVNEAVDDGVEPSDEVARAFEDAVRSCAPAAGDGQDGDGS